MHPEPQVNLVAAELAVPPSLGLRRPACPESRAMQLTPFSRLLVYIGAAAFDMVSGTLLFVVPVRAAQLGASYSLVGALGVTWGIGCAISTFVLSRFVTQSNAAVFCITGCLVQALSHFGLILSTDAAGMFPFLAIAGLSHTVFFSPYQLFVKTVDHSLKLPLHASVGVYTLAWSLGMAVGPLWSGFLMRISFLGLAGWQWCLVFTVCACLAVATSVRHIRRRLALDTLEKPTIENDRPDFVRLAWAAALCGTFAFSLVRGIFPAGAVKLGVPENIQGGVIFCMGLLQALSGFSLRRVREGMYRPDLLLFMGFLGVAGMASFLLAFLGVFSGPWLTTGFFLGALLFGVYSGSFYFYTVFHSLVHPSRAGFNIAINEGMFAVANTLGLLVGGILADAFGVNFPFLLAAVCIAAFTLAQFYYHAKAPWPTALPEFREGGD